MYIYIYIYIYIYMNLFKMVAHDNLVVAMCFVLCLSDLVVVSFAGPGHPWTPDGD